MAERDARAALVETQLQRFGLSYRWLAEQLGTTHVSVAAWLRGDNKPRDKSMWTRALQTLREYEKSTKATGTLEVQRVGLQLVPVYPGLSAGSPTSAEADVEYLELKDWGNRHERWARVIDGFSMVPLLEPGDIVVFEERPWEPNHVVHAYKGGDDTVKVACGRGSTTQLVPVNEDYPILEAKDWSVKGVAVMRIRKGAQSSTHTDEWPYGLRYVPESR